MVDRLKDLGRLPASFDMEVWLADITAKTTKSSGGKYSKAHQETILKDLGIYSHLDWKLMASSHKATDAYKAHMKDKPKERAPPEVKDT
jgi:hypothetical protein